MVTKTKIEKNGKVGFIFSTYDGASFLWDDFFKLMRRFWPDFDTAFDGYISMCEKEEIVATERLTIKPVGLSNSESTYSERLAECINRLNCEYVFIILDDYYLKSEVDVKRLEETIAFLKNNKRMDCITYENFRSKVLEREFELPYLKQLKKVMFICNLQIGLWRASSLQKLLRLYESPWQFEYYGSIRACLQGLKSLTIKKGEPPVFDYDFGWLLQRGKFDKKTFAAYAEKGLVDTELGERIGFYEPKPHKKHGMLFKLKHGMLALLSILKK